MTARPKSAPPAQHPSSPREITLRVSVPAAAILDVLVGTGLFGASSEEAAERILCDGLRRLLMEYGEP